MKSLEERRKNFEDKLFKVHHGEIICLNPQDYKNNSTKLRFKCMKCGHVWEAIPNNIIRGQGCPHCVGKCYTTEEVIAMSRAVHGDKYEYPDEYKGMHKLWRIICPIHGEFFQTPYHHIQRKQDCPKCSSKKISDKLSLTTEEVIAMARAIHGDKYQYPDPYVNMDTPWRIICPIHGEFFQTPHNHIHSKSGCPDCGKEIQIKKQRKSISQLKFDILKASKGNIICLNPEDYKNNRSKLWFLCTECGNVWKTRVGSILNNGSGCPKCGIEKIKEKLLLTTEEVIAMARAIHGDKYQYPDPYEGMDKLWRIICPIHGEFFQTPSHHIYRKQKCPKCYNNWKLEEDVKKLLTDNNIEFIREKKFRNELGEKRYDFLLPKLNSFIECQGIQHFEPVEHFGGFEKFKDQIESDQIKKKYAENNGYTILYYTDRKLKKYPYPICLSIEELFEKIKEHLT